MSSTECPGPVALNTPAPRVDQSDAAVASAIATSALTELKVDGPFAALPEVCTALLPSHGSEPCEYIRQGSRLRESQGTDSWDSADVRELQRVLFNNSPKGLALRTPRGWFVPVMVVWNPGELAVEDDPTVFEASPGGRSWLRIDLRISASWDTGRRSQSDNTATSSSRTSLFCAFSPDRAPTCLLSPPTDTTTIKYPLAIDAEHQPGAATVTTPGDGTIVIDSMQPKRSVFALPE